MIKLKSNQLAYKLFWALCILGSGIHVHGVESNQDGEEKIAKIVPSKSEQEAGSRLLQAAQRGNVEEVGTFIQDPKATEDAVQRTFAAAVMEAREQVVEYLLRKNRPGHMVTQETVQDAFTWTAGNGRTTIMEQLLALEEDDDRKITQPIVVRGFYTAVQQGDANTMKQFLALKSERKITQPIVRDVFTWTAGEGLTTIMEQLLALEEDDDRKITQPIVQEAFTIAARGESTESMELLLALQGEREVTENNVLNTFTLAVIDEKEQVVKYLLRKNRPGHMVNAKSVHKIFEHAAYFGKANIMELLLALEEDDDRKITEPIVQEAFLTAVTKGRTTIMEQLLALEGKREVAAWAVENAFKWAACHQRKDIVEQLLALKEGDTRKITQPIVQSAFTIATRAGSTEIMERLFSVEKEREVTAQTVENAFKIATDKGLESVMGLLDKMRKSRPVPSETVENGPIEFTSLWEQATDGNQGQSMEESKEQDVGTQGGQEESNEESKEQEE